MKSLLTLLSIAVALVVLPLVAEAGVIWANDVTAYSTKIQNFGGTKMSEDAAYKSWVIGAPDADADDNGYARNWDQDDQHNVAGWKSNAPNEYIVVHFAAGLADVSDDDDLTIRLYGGPDAKCKVLASTDDTYGTDTTIFTEIGLIGGGDPGYLRDETFEFNGLLGVHYVKVLRDANGSGTGMFFDAFGGTAVPEPGTMTLLLAAVGFVAAWRWNRSRKPR